MVKNVFVVEARAHVSALLAEGEAGGQAAVMRHGKVVARPVAGQAQTPDQMQTALDALRHLWAGDTHTVDLQEPADSPPRPVGSIGATPVTDSECEFRRVDGLLLENWLA